MTNTTGPTVSHRMAAKTKGDTVTHEEKTIGDSAENGLEEKQRVLRSQRG